MQLSNFLFNILLAKELRCTTRNKKHRAESAKILNTFDKHPLARIW